MYIALFIVYTQIIIASNISAKHPVQNKLCQTMCNTSRLVLQFSNNCTELFNYGQEFLTTCFNNKCLTKETITNTACIDINRNLEKNCFQRINCSYYFVNKFPHLSPRFYS